MLTKLRIKNFKAWEESGELRLSPLTVLFGTNSAGKTSIPQLLLLLKQTVESPDRRRALHLGGAGSLADVGAFEDVVHDHELERPVEFTLGWSLEEPLTVHDPMNEKDYVGDRLEFRATLTADSKHQPRISSFRYELQLGELTVADLELTETPGQARVRKQVGYEMSSSTYPLIRHPGRAGLLPEPLRFYGFPDEVRAFYQNAAFTSDLVLQLERVLKSVFYVGPLREYPKRMYLWSGETPDHVGAKGERAVEAILAAQGRSFDWKPEQEPKELLLLVAERLKQMGLIHEFKVEPLGPGRNEYEVLVRTGPTRPKVKLTDVGFGVSQVLPVIVESLYVPKRSIVIFEQPEVHLHPSVQAALADLFVDAIRAREDGAARDCQFIVESHSEHFLRRLQLRIAERELSSDDVALYFVHTEDGDARIQQLDVDRFGNIKNWPENLFGDEMGDLVARSEAQARRTREGD